MFNTISLFLALLALALLPARTTQAQTGQIVVELFTSQGCSSCPPADRYLNEMSEHPGLITLSFHVTYWDRGNWKDTLGRTFATNRQKEYARHMKLGQMYTPQMIVNGQGHFVGSRKNELTTALKSATSVEPIALSKNSGNVLTIKLPSFESGKNTGYSLYLYGLKKASTVKIGSGENRGKLFTYKNAVLYEQPLGLWHGNGTTKYVSLPNDPDLDRYVLLVQRDTFGPVIAAGKIDI